MNSEKTIFTKHNGSKHIIYGLFVDDKMHTSSSGCDEIQDKFSDCQSFQVLKSSPISRLGFKLG
jgi:hypothetical protein